jgi:uncharacterized protein YidB (DUF937 family)
MKGILAVIAGILVVGVAVVAVHGALAQGSDNERSGDKFIAKTAEKLGISTDELTTAMSNAQFDLIDEAVANGKLTEHEAAKLKERVNEYGPLSALGLKHRKQAEGVCRGAKLAIGAAADVLQMDRAEIVSAVRSGQSLAEIAQSKGMSVEDFKAALLQAVKGKLDAKVTEGTITQEQADRAYTAIQGKIDQIVEFKGGSEAGPCHRWRDGEKEREALPSATS